MYTFSAAAVQRSVKSSYPENSPKNVFHKVHFFQSCMQQAHHLQLYLKRRLPYSWSLCITQQ